jgi:hypothetical protein
MKTKDLIAALQTEDPSGELEVSVGNIDIHFVEKEPAYYDGCLQVLKRDESQKDCYNIIGGEFRSQGDKIVIHALALKSVLWDVPDAEITYDSDYARNHYANIIEEERLRVKSFKTNRRKRDSSP